MCPIKHAARVMRVKREFLFHRFNPSTRTCTHTSYPTESVYTRIYKGPRRFSFRRYSPFFKLGKKRDEHIPSYSGPPYQITPPPFHLFIHRSRVPLAPFASRTGVREKKIRRHWVATEIGAARTSIRNEDGKYAVTTCKSFLI